MSGRALPRIRFGKTGWKVTRLGIGTIPLIKQPERATDATLNRALDRGITLVDVAEQYENMQHRVGKFISHRRGEFVLTTKTYSRTSREARKSLESALKALKTDHIDGYMMHSVSCPAEWEGVRAKGGCLETFRKAQGEGLIGQIGVSIHRDLRVMREAIESGLFGFMMLAYSPLDQENVAAEILPLARRHDIGVMLMKAMAGGQLVPEPTDMSAEEADRLKRLSIRFCLSNPNVHSVVVGMKSPEEVDFNVAAACATLPIDEQRTAEMRRLIGRISKDFRYGQMCLRCYYCQPCPEGVPIPEVFRAGDALSGYPDDLKPLADEMYAKLGFRSEMCVECGECVAKCPAGIEIPRKLRDVAEAFAARRVR
ncbi:MAG: aldo/keto reductase [Phycisphaerae bacterium]|nr:aldo/keto reductase [Phycisphaerae bacterium]